MKRVAIFMGIVIAFPFKLYIYDITFWKEKRTVNTNGIVKEITIENHSFSGNAVMLFLRSIKR
ncbi:hypothetical protein IQ31_05516 [Sphingobacterium siyangense]|uniref:Uncharacterized protein n=1 Tax=Sphingobacterium siyangense TaxID=459529 RepID=A0A562LZX2_9SPHI|nr:hypothetical protein IQ31_05516 [Sphingobacterium siyangense]